MKPLDEIFAGLQDDPHGASSAVAPRAPHVRDPFDLGQMRALLFLSLLPCISMALYNTGYQANLAVSLGGSPLAGWRSSVFTTLGGQFAGTSVPSSILLGALYFLPAAAVAVLSAFFVETLNARQRGRRPSNAYLISGVLLALSLPPTAPLWQVALGMAFGVLFGQEVFGGPGMTFLNPVLVGRAFLFFAYPAEMSGDAPWIAAAFTDVDGFSGATPLSRAMLDPASFAELQWWDAFTGRIPGSMGETSALACALGGMLLIATRIVSWQTIAGAATGTLAAAWMFNSLATDPGSMRALPFHWHIVTGGWAFGMVFLATDPSSSPFTDGGRWLHGIGIGALTVLIRVANPAYTEGVMLAILFMSVFAPLINFIAAERTFRRRRARGAA